MGLWGADPEEIHGALGIKEVTRSQSRSEPFEEEWSLTLLVTDKEKGGYGM